jgi:hypothetical protein
MTILFSAERRSFRARHVRAQTFPEILYIILLAPTSKGIWGWGEVEAMLSLGE